MPDDKLQVVKTSHPTGYKKNRHAKKRETSVEYVIHRLDSLQETVPLLQNFIKLKRKVESDSRALNYLISTLCQENSDNFTLRKIWLIFKDKLLPTIDLSTAIFLVQASGINVTEQGKLSRLYYIKAAHAYTLKAKNGNQRFYINLVHSLHSCGCKDLTDIYTQIQDPTFNIPPESRDKLKTLLDAAVQEYQTFGLRNNVVYPDDQHLPQTQSTTKKHQVINQAEQLLQEMAACVDKQIKDHCSTFSDLHEKVEEFKTQTPTVTEKSELSHEEATLLLAGKQQHYITAIQCAAEEKNWINAMAIFDHAITEIPNSALLYNAMLLAADKCNCDPLYAKHLYVKATTENFADINTYINAFLVFSKTYDEFPWAWYTYSEIKRLGGINTTICSLMATIAILYKADVYAIAVWNDVAENKFNPPNEIYDRAREMMEQAKRAEQLGPAILEVSVHDNSITPQNIITDNAKSISPLSASVAQSEYSLFGIRSSQPVSKQAPQSSFSLYTP